MSEIPKAPDANASIGSYAKISAIKKATRSKAFPLFVLLVLIVVVFAILSQMRTGAQSFLKVSTFLSILQNITTVGLLTLGVACLIVSGQIDLSSASVGSMGGVIIAVGLAWWGMHWVVCIIITIVGAAVVGTINAVLVNELKQPAFVATMATNTILTAVLQILTTNKVGTTLASITFNHSIIQQIGTYKLVVGHITETTRRGALIDVPIEIPVAAIVMVILYVIYGLALSKSKFGRTLYLIGGNQAAARLAGINPRKISYFLFINCSVLASLAGIVNVSRTQTGAPAALATFQFSGMTAAILGGISFGGGSGGMGGAFLGLMVINVFNTGVTASLASPYLTPVLSGSLLLLALTFDYFNVRAQNKRVGA